MPQKFTPLVATLIALLATVHAYSDPVQELPAGIDDDARYIDQFDSAPAPNDISSDSEVEVINERYDTGEVKIRREVMQDEAGNYVHHGEWRAFDKEGNQVAVGRYQNGRPDCRWTYVHSAKASKLYSTVPYKDFTSPFTSTATLQDGKLHGTWSIIDSEQRTISLIEFVDGQRHGLCKLYLPSGELMQDITYVNGLIEGPLRQWDADGNLVIDDTYQKGRKLALRVGYDKAGKKKSEGMYLHPQIVVDTPDDWSQARPATFKSVGTNDRHGNWMEWYSNGKEKVVGNYKYDLRDGEFTWWHPNGQKRVNGNYENGNEYGVWVWWHQNGQKAAQGYYVDGDPTNTWAFWKPDGQLTRKSDISELTKPTLEAELNPPSGTDIEPSTADDRNRFRATTIDR